LSFTQEKDLAGRLCLHHQISATTNAAVAKGEKLTTVNQKGAAIVEEMAVVVVAAAAAGSTSATMAIVLSPG